MPSADQIKTMPRLVAVEPSVMRTRAFAQWAHGSRFIFDEPALHFLDDVAVAASELEDEPSNVVPVIKAAYLHRLPLDTDVPDQALELLFPHTKTGPSPAVIALTVSRETDQPHPDPERRRIETFQRIFNGGSLTRYLSLCERFTRATWAYRGRLPISVIGDFRAEHSLYSSIVRVLNEHRMLWSSYEELLGINKVSA